METLQIIYTAFAVVGGLFLLLSLFSTDEGIDIDLNIDIEIEEPDFDISDRVFSLRTISIFLLGGGVAGWTAFNAGATLGMQIFWAFITGILIAAIYYFVIQRLYKKTAKKKETK